MSSSSHQGRTAWGSLPSCLPAHLPVAFLASMLNPFGIRMVLAGLSPQEVRSHPRAIYGTLTSGSSHRQWGGQESPFYWSSLEGRHLSCGWDKAYPGGPSQALAWPSPALDKEGGCPSPSELQGPGRGEPLSAGCSILIVCVCLCVQVCVHVYT